MFVLRFIFPLLLALTSLAVVATPLAENFVSHWFQRDVELRSALIFQSVEYSLTDLWNQGKRLESYKKLFDNIARDERVLAVGICSAEGKLIAKSTQWPKNFDCPASLLSSKPEYAVQQLEKGAMLSGSFQLPVEDALKPHFVVLHDLSRHGRHRARRGRQTTSAGAARLAGAGFETGRNTES
jgi:trehalose 6-phosphate synthase/phosphatase